MKTKNSRLLICNVLAVLMFIAGQGVSAATLLLPVSPTGEARAARAFTSARNAGGEDAVAEGQHRPCLTCGAGIRAAAPASIRTPMRSGLSFSNRGGKKLNASCQSLFVRPDGGFGPAGQKIASLVSGPYSSWFMANNSLSAVCPRFNEMKTTKERTDAWVWFWMVLANEESTCNVSLPHGTHLPNGKRLNPKRGWGLFAAELYEKDRAWRGRACRGNIKSADVQISCAVHTMADLQLQEGRGVIGKKQVRSRRRGVRTVHASYWGPIRRASSQIIPNMRGFKACF